MYPAGRRGLIAVTQYAAANLVLAGTTSPTLITVRGTDGFPPISPIRGVTIWNALGQLAVNFWDQGNGLGVSRKIFAGRFRTFNVSETDTISFQQTGVPMIDTGLVIVELSDWHVRPQAGNI